MENNDSIEIKIVFPRKLMLPFGKDVLCCQYVYWATVLCTSK